YAGQFQGLDGRGQLNFAPEEDAMHWLDPSYLPVTTGTVHQFVLNPHGDADGMIFTCGTEVQFPPHMAPEICAAEHPSV
ncbi:MAG: hypothetical protein WBV79_14870, partial [Rhodomicrobium sp.]